MVDKIKNFFSPPTFEDQNQTQAATLLNAFLLITIAATVLFLAAKIPGFIESGFIASDFFLLGFIPVNIALLFVMRRGYLEFAGFAYVTQMWLLLTAQAWLFNGVSDSGLAAYVLVIIASALLLGWRATFLFTGLSVAATWVIAYFQENGQITVEYQAPYGYALTWTILFVIMTSMEYLIINALTKARQLSEERSEQLTVLTSKLDGQARRRAADLLNIAEIGSSLTQMRNVEEVMQHAISMLYERYELYHAQIYLLGHSRTLPHEDRLILRAATGEIGKRLLAQVHQLPVTALSSNGLAVLERQSTLDVKTAVSYTHRRHPLLPDTKSEVVIPLLVGDRVLGTLDLHHVVAGGFDEESVPVFETIGSQLAAAIENALLFTQQQQAEEALRSSEALFGSVIDNATAVIYVKQVDGKYMLVNKLYEDLFGISSEDIQGKTDYDVFPVENADALRKRDMDVLNQRGTIVSEEEIPHADGLRIYISTKFPLFNEQGEAYAVAGILTDITNIKTAELTLADRVAELDLFNSIGRKIEENTPIPAFLEWAATQIPTAMSHIEGCTAAIQWDGQLYGDADARQRPRHIIEEMQVQNHRVGYITVAYDNPEHNFEDEDSALAGSVGQRIAAYLQMQLLLKQTQVHSDDLQTVTEVGTAVSVILDPHTLLKSAVDLIKEKFGLYHASIFLLDDLNQELISTVGAGEIGDAMTASPGVLRMSDPHSVIARSARRQRWFALNDVKSELNYISHPQLADVAAELAIPMQLGDELLGVLDVQSTEVNAFSEEKAIVYTTLATQIAIALQNARQHERTQVALDEVNLLQQVAAQEGWRTFARRDGYLATADGVQELTENGRLQIDDSNHVIMPMRVRGAQIGNIAVRADAGSISDADQGLLDAISAQVAEALERARFFEEIEQARHHTETLYNIGRVLPTIETSSELLRTIADGAAESINADQVLLLLCDVEKERMVDTVAGGVGREKVGLDIEFSDIWNGLSGWTLRERKTAFSPKFVRDERESTLAYDYRLTHDVGSLVVVPLIYQDKILGTLTAINLLEQPDFTQAEVDLLTAFGIQATVAIENRNLLDETEKRAGREQTLRTITNHVNTAVDAESVLKTAVKEVGRAMGLEIFAYLDDSVSMDSSVDAKDVG